LNLPRRTEVAHGEPRVENFAERGAGDRVGGVAKVGMVENIEHLGAELQVEPLRDFRVLDDGEIGVDEVRTRKRIASCASGMATSGDDGIDAVPRRAWSRVVGGGAERARNLIRGIRYIGTGRNRGRSAVINIWSCRAYNYSEAHTKLWSRRRFPHAGRDARGQPRLSKVRFGWRWTTSYAKALLVPAYHVPPMARSFGIGNTAPASERAVAPQERNEMRTILLIVLVLLILGALPTWPYSAGWGYYPSGGLGLLLVILLILAVLGKL
jgi:hypothetical protein